MVWWQEFVDRRFDSLNLKVLGIYTSRDDVWDLIWPAFVSGAWSQHGINSWSNMQMMLRSWWLMSIALVQENPNAMMLASKGFLLSSAWVEHGWITLESTGWNSLADTKNSIGSQRLLKKEGHVQKLVAVEDVFSSKRGLCSEFICASNETKQRTQNQPCHPDSYWWNRIREIRPPTSYQLGVSSGMEILMT